MPYGEHADMTVKMQTKPSSEFLGVDLRGPSLYKNKYKYNTIQFGDI